MVNALEETQALLEGHDRVVEATFTSAGSRKQMKKKSNFELISKRFDRTEQNNFRQNHFSINSLLRFSIN